MVPFWEATPLGVALPPLEVSGVAPPVVGGLVVGVSLGGVSIGGVSGEAIGAKVALNMTSLSVTV